MYVQHQTLNLSSHMPIEILIYLFSKIQDEKCTNTDICVLGVFEQVDSVYDFKAWFLICNNCTFIIKLCMFKTKLFPFNVNKYAFPNIFLSCKQYMTYYVVN